MFSCEVCGGNGQHLVSCQHYPEWAAELIAALEKERDELRAKVALQDKMLAEWEADPGFKRLQAQLAQATEALRLLTASSLESGCFGGNVEWHKRLDYGCAALRQSVPASPAKEKP